MKKYRRSTIRRAISDTMDDGKWWYFLDLVREAQVAPIRVSVVYDALDQWKKIGVVEATWAPGPYPRRRLYRKKPEPGWLSFSIRPDGTVQVTDRDGNDETSPVVRDALRRHLT